MIEKTTESAWGDGKLYHGTARYFDVKKCQLMQAGGRQVNLVQGRDENKAILDGKVRAWITTDQGKQVLFVEFTTGPALTLEETHVYAGLASAGRPPNAPGQFNSKDPIIAESRRSLHRIESVVSGSGPVNISDLGDSAIIRLAAHAVVVIY